MNTSYRSVWNESLCAWVATSEITSARCKRSRSSVAKAIATIALLGGFGCDAAFAQVVGAGGALVLGTNTPGGSSGRNSSATGVGAIAVGSGATAISPANGGSNNAIAIGTDAYANPGATSVGNAAIAIGQGASATSYSAIAVGENAKASGTASPVAIGWGAMATGTGSATAIGDNAAATGENAIAIGGNPGSAGATASGDFTTAIGQGVQATQTGGVAIGHNATATYQNDVALGSSSITAAPHIGTTAMFGGVAAGVESAKSTNGVVAVGAPGAERQIQNMAAGVISASSTDAINGSQLFVTNAAVTALGTTVTNLGTSVATNLGGGSTYNTTTGVVSAPSYNVYGTTVNNVGAAITVLQTLSPVQYSDAAGNATPQTPSQSVTLVGEAAGPVTVNNVAPGALTSSSTQAVNGSQLYAVEQTANKGWSVTTAQTGSGTVTGTTVSNVAPGDTATFTAGNNVAISQNGLNVAIATSMTPTFTSETIGAAGATGNTTIGAMGLTVNNGANSPSITTAGINGGNLAVTNIAPGVNGTDAVDVNQLNAVAKAAGAGWGISAQHANATTVSAVSPTGANVDLTNTDGNIVVSKTAASNDVTFGLAPTVNVANAVNVGGSNGTSITANGVTTGGGTGPSLTTNGIDAAGTRITNVAPGVNPTDAAAVSQLPGRWQGSNTFVMGNPSSTGPVTITNVAPGQINATSTEAVNGSQLSAVSQVANAGWNVTTAQTGSGSATGTAVANVAPGSTMTLTAGDNMVATQNGTDVTFSTSATPSFTSVTTGNTVINNNGLTIVSGPSVTVNGIDAGNKTITHVAPGVNGSDAVTVNQLTNTVAAGATHYYSVNDTGAARAAGTGTNYDNLGATGIRSMAVGQNATATTNDSIAMGYGASLGTNAKNVIGNYAVAMGNNSLAYLASVSIGYQAGYQSTSPGGPNHVNGGENVFVGFQSGAQSSVNDSVFIGQQAGQRASGEHNTGVGEDAQRDTVGNNNAGFGTGAGQGSSAANQAVGNQNTATGYYAGTNFKGNNNTAVGTYSGQSVTGNRNVANGDMAGSSVTGDNNVGTGYLAGYGVQGNNNIASGNAAGYRVVADDTISVGTQARASANDAIAIGHGAIVYGISSISIGTGNVVSGNRSGAIGDPSYINADDSYAIGNNNTINASAKQSFVLGNNVTVNNANNVVLGNASADKAVVQVNSATVPTTIATLNPDGTVTYTAGPVLTYGGFAGAAQAAGVVSVGSATATRQIVNLAPGEISATSTDAVNGSQLNAVSQLANAGWNVTTAKSGTGTATGTSVSNVAPGSTMTLTAGDNMVATQNGTNVTFSTSATPSFTSVTTGNTVINNNGLTIASGPSVTVNGIDAGNRTITNVAPGVNATDAATVGQLPGQWQGSNTFVMNNTSSTGPVTITNVAAGKNPTDAVNVSQLADQTSAVTSAGLNFTDATGTNVIHENLGGTLPIIGATVALSGLTLSTVAPTAGAYSSSNVQTVADPVTGKLQVQIADNPVFQSVIVGGNVFNTNGMYIGGAGSGGPSISTAGINGGGKMITNIAAGQNGTDAVDVDQLNALAGKVDSLGNTVANNFGGSSTYNSSTGTVNAPSYGSGNISTAAGSETNNVAAGLQTAANTWVTGNPTTYTPPVASGTNSTAVGNGATSSGNNSVALGNNSTDGGRANVVSVGSPGEERQITNVAPGTQSTDAVNVGQLNNAIAQNQQQFNQLGNAINSYRKDAMAGTAAAMAMANLPQAYLPGKSMASAAAATTGGQSSIAIGVSTLSDNGKWVVKMSGTGNTRGQFGVAAGAGFQW
ncbi:YadA-like family protein [Paraburkholderia sp. MMS20-SJTR3]|uniref:YadA-like family protein n=1 Tax=Paraburkholderia sejongensis TaxID=2886946 RepID=A0ABS8K5R5_9BURK|nr:ESPR-type extended signal peptide-containing protein [Paraburkholderia sp. MMS20-SJTR3]MCC8397493.1 YadA-like family protein [Paraburkholderia sp. MMS20-SJTR3]